MKYLIFNKEKSVIHCQSGIAKSRNIFHIKRNMPMTELMIMQDGELHIKHLEDYVLHPNDVFFLPQNVLHYGSKKSTFTIHWIHFILPSDFLVIEDNELKNYDPENNIILPMQFNVSKIENIINIAIQLEQYPLTQATQDVRNSLMKTLLFDIMLRQSDYDRTFLSHKRLNSILNYINSNIEKPISVQNLTNIFGYNDKYIFNLFKRYIGVPPLQYIINQKMNLAKNLLLSTDNTIEQISFELGYSNPQYFMRLFKRTFNSTPSEFRKTYSHSLELFYSSKE